jgi:hypothetical protein
LGAGIKLFLHALSIGLFSRYMFFSWTKHSDTHILQIQLGTYLGLVIK